MTSTEENKRVVRTLFEAFSRGDLPAVLELISDDAPWSAPGPPVVPLYGERRGREGAREFFSQLGSNVEFKKFEVWELIAEGDSVVVTGSERGRVKGTREVLRQRLGAPLQGRRRQGHALSLLRQHGRGRRGFFLKGAAWTS